MRKSIEDEFQSQQLFNIINSINCATLGRQWMAGRGNCFMEYWWESIEMEGEKNLMGSFKFKLFINSFTFIYLRKKNGAEFVVCRYSFPWRACSVNFNTIGKKGYKFLINRNWNHHLEYPEADTFPTNKP